MLSSLAATLRDLEIAERRSAQEHNLVVSVSYEPSSGQIEIALMSGLTLQSDRDLDFAKSIAEALDAPYPSALDALDVPLDPSLDESWALLHYDLAMTLNALDECVPDATVTKVSREGELATITVSGNGEEMIYQHSLRGSTLNGIGAELMLQWNGLHLIN